MENTNNLEKNISTLTKIAALFFLIGTAFGFILITIYGFSIGYPILSLTVSANANSTLMFIFIAMIYGIFYLIFTLIMTAIGTLTLSTFNIVIKYIYKHIKISTSFKKIICKKVKAIANNNQPLIYLFALFTVVIAPLALTIYILPSGEHRDTMLLIVTSLSLGLLVKMLMLTNAAVKSLVIVLGTAILLAPAIIIPTFATTIFNATINITRINIKPDQMNIYIQESFATLIPNHLIKESESLPSGFKEFKDIEVLWPGIGGKTIIKYQLDKNTYKILELHSDNVIIQHLQKRKEDNNKKDNQ